MSLTDKTLGEVALNPDGKTYDGAKAIRWMYEAVTGKSLTDAEARDIMAKGQALAKARREAKQGE